MLLLLFTGHPLTIDAMKLKASFLYKQTKQLYESDIKLPLSPRYEAAASDEQGGRIFKPMTVHSTKEGEKQLLIYHEKRGRRKTHISFIKLHANLIQCFHLKRSPSPMVCMA